MSANLRLGLFPALSAIARAFGGEYQRIQVFTSTGTWNKRPGLKRLVVIVQGAGGGSGGCAATGVGEASVSGGGASGALAIKTIEAKDLNPNETVTVGTGGAAGTAGNNAGGTGNTSSFGSQATATGGVGGSGSTNSAGSYASAIGSSGGTASGGDVNIQGNASSGAITLAAVPNQSGLGAASPLFGGAVKGVTGAATGNPGGQYGGGASGSCLTASQAARVGAVGADGIVVVLEFY